MIERMPPTTACRQRAASGERLKPDVMRRTSLTAAFILGFGVAAYAIAMYGLGPGAERLHPEMRAAFESHPIGIQTHIFASALALLLGPIQFSARLRLKRPSLHRWSGRVYLGVAVAIGGAAGLYMSQYAFGGLLAKLGFAGLAIAWLFTGARAFVAARNRDFVSHRRWMIRNWLCWVPNLLVAEWLAKTTHSRRC
jgi:uncharacterized membrane protein